MVEKFDRQMQPANATEKSVVSAVRLCMLVVRNGIEQPQHMYARPSVETIQKRRVRGLLFAREFQFWIIDDHVAIVIYTKLAAHLQHDLHFIPFNTCCPSRYSAAGSRRGISGFVLLAYPCGSIACGE